MTEEDQKSLIVRQLEALLAKAESKHDQDVELFGHASPRIVAEIARLKFVISNHGCTSKCTAEELALAQLKAAFRKIMERAEAEKETNGQASDATNAEIKRLYLNIQLKGFILSLKKAKVHKKTEEILFGEPKAETITLITRLEFEIDKLQKEIK